MQTMRVYHGVQIKLSSGDDIPIVACNFAVSSVPESRVLDVLLTTYRGSIYEHNRPLAQSTPRYSHLLKPSAHSGANLLSRCLNSQSYKIRTEDSLKITLIDHYIVFKMQDKDKDKLYTCII